MVRTLHWDLPDPAAFEGSDEEKREQIRALSHRIEALVLTLIDAIDGE